MKAFALLIVVEGVVFQARGGDIYAEISRSSNPDPVSLEGDCPCNGFYPPQERADLDFKACATICLAWNKGGHNSDCEAFSWKADPNPKKSGDITCVLKTAACSNPDSDPTSGGFTTFIQPRYPTFSALNGDCPGNELQSFSGLDLQQCIKKCVIDEDCYAFSWGDSEANREVNCVTKMQGCENREATPTEPLTMYVVDAPPPLQSCRDEL